MDSLPPSLSNASQVAGLALFAVIGFKLLRGIMKSVLSSPRKPSSYGKWAAVTGATDGIGKALCFELAKQGMSIMLISRTESKLKLMADELKVAYPTIETQYLAVDYSNFDKTAQAKVKAALEKLDSFGILINNVGMSYPFPLYFHELSDDEVSSMIELNVNSTTWMTRIALPIMLPNKNGAILNIGSAAGLHPNPLLALYSATKSYVEYLSHSLNTEYGPKGITVQCHVPLFIVSKLSKYKKSTAFVPTTELYAKEALATLGLDPVVSPHFPHRVASCIMSLVPQSIVQSLSLRFHLGIRTKGLKKREREAKAQ